jgi:hypothetical protein
MNALVIKQLSGIDISGFSWYSAVMSYWTSVCYGALTICLKPFLDHYVVVAQSTLCPTPVGIASYNPILSPPLKSR